MVDQKWYYVLNKLHSH